MSNFKWENCCCVKSGMWYVVCVMGYGNENKASSFVPWIALSIKKNNKIKCHLWKSEKNELKMGEKYYISSSMLYTVEDIICYVPAQSRMPFWKYKKLHIFHGSETPFILFAEVFFLKKNKKKRNKKKCWNIHVYGF